MVADPQGAAFYVMKPIPPEGRENEASDVFSSDRDGRVSWNELSTSDPAAARHFYGEQFGWTSDDFVDMGEHGEYRFFAPGVRLEVTSMAHVVRGEEGVSRWKIVADGPGPLLDALTFVWRWGTLSQTLTASAEAEPVLRRLRQRYGD